MNRGKVQRTCAHCNHQFRTYPSRKNKKYCNKACKDGALRDMYKKQKLYEELKKRTNTERIIQAVIVAIISLSIGSYCYCNNICIKSYVALLALAGILLGVLYLPYGFKTIGNWCKKFWLGE